mmetsp:Transcript_8340/g.23194  ORF Transcript_8340/g.23194 Transcript_8340/m.23194 type:complete len:545 (-) Transcript_8340:245-1879(-)|eukprot:CAMPEP_0194505242 /NCGR_PEP_ID=MMETSP0253-20130528/31326_1 /TAXON_ID=2966 /ORGANISM="Noctiluca scintillans" /LENGTH=544 /DNA_ID=CAMNT_0039347753 /DNA_START=35 /DNA_END=1669 /DNA_ORIENTATION=-
MSPPADSPPVVAKRPLPFDERSGHVMGPPLSKKRHLTDSQPMVGSLSTPTEEVSHGGEAAALLQLFDTLEYVLRLYRTRGRRALHQVVRADVESAVGKSLCEERVGRLLALSSGMLEARWFGIGASAELELWQRVDGEARSPTPAEQIVRRHTFRSSLISAGESLPAPCLPHKELSPVRPDTGSVRPDTGSPATHVEPDARSLQDSFPLRLAARDTNLSQRAATRQAALLERVRAREVATMSETALALQDMRARAVLCDDALTIHAVVNSLFTVNESNVKSALEAQVLKGACSQSHSQCSRPLALPEARAALAYLRSVSSAWFLVEDAQHSKDVRIFKLTDANEARSVVEILREERRRLERAIHEYELGKALSAETRGLLRSLSGLEGALPRVPAAPRSASATPSVALSGKPVDTKRALIRNVSEALRTPFLLSRTTSEPSEPAPRTPRRPTTSKRPLCERVSSPKPEAPLSCRSSRRFAEETPVVTKEECVVEQGYADVKTFATPPCTPTPRGRTCRVATPLSAMLQECPTSGRKRVRGKKCA